ncbi:MAG: AAA family ATPase [Candidatus Riflebacteria bacterium]
MTEIKPDQLSRVKIRGFKSIEDCDLELGPINLLIGSNGSGKSNFISVFLLLQSIVEENLSLYAGQCGIESLFFKGRKQTEEIFVEFFFNLNSYGFSLVPTDDNLLMFKREFFGYHGDYENESNVSRGHRESLWQKGTGNRLAKYVKPILEKQSWRVYHFHDTGRNARVKSEHNVSDCRHLLFDAGNLAAFLLRLRRHFPDSYPKIIENIRLVAPYFSDFDLEPNESNPEKIVLRWKQRGCDGIFNASQLSDGALRFICLTTLLLQPESLQPATIIIDEPELGLHPYALTIFAEMVRKVSLNKQIILSTQSVELLNEFNPENIIVVDRINEGSEFKRLDSDSLKEWLENDYSLGELWNKNLLGGRVQS